MAKPPSAPSDTEYVTVAEIAAQMRLSKMTVYRLVHSGEIPGAIHAGRSIRIPRTSVTEWRKNNTAVTIPAASEHLAREALASRGPDGQLTLTFGCSTGPITVTVPPPLAQLFIPTITNIKENQ